MRAFIAGPNFSGRSAMLKARLEQWAKGSAFFIGPYAEAALSGLSSTVADEIDIYGAAAPGGRAAFTSFDASAYAERKPQTLSGGEQVLLALHCFSRSHYRVIGIDTALEQLDPENRASALAYLGAEDCDVGLIDNRLTAPSGWTVSEAPDRSAAFACDPGRAVADLAPRAAPVIAFRGLSFGYRPDRPIFSDAEATLTPGRAYRLAGPNGAGKTTLFKLLAGVLVPSAGQLSLDGAAYAPWREGNRVFAFSTQNPDHQWCGVTLGEDLARRRGALARRNIAVPNDAAIGALAQRFGVGVDQHLYELPLAARKRLSWLWPFSGVMPWIMLDEPTVGQDRATRKSLAEAVARLCALGSGILFITHDNEFAADVPHQALHIESQTIRC